MGAARLRAELFQGQLDRAVDVASAIPVEEIVANLGVHAAARPWGCAVSGGRTHGLVVLAGGLVIPYSGKDWESFVAGAAMTDELVALRRGWIVTPQGQDISFGFDPGADGAVDAVATLGVMMHLGIDLPTPLGLGGVAEGPDGAKIKGRDAWSLFCETAPMWVAAAGLFGAERVLEALANRSDGRAPGAVKLLQTLYPGATVRQPDAASERFVIDDRIEVYAEPEAWKVGVSNGYYVTRWRVRALS